MEDGIIVLKMNERVVEMSYKNIYARGIGTDKECVQYGEKLIQTDDAQRDMETLKCYHDIMCGSVNLAFTPIAEYTRIQQWCRQVEYAFGLITGE